MTIWLLQIVIGCVVLGLGAERFIVSTSGLAQRWGIPPIVAGIILLGFGTSLPEMIVSGMAAWQGHAAMGVGNAIGSCITNIGLVLGVTALIRPMRVNSTLLKREFPVMFLLMGCASALMFDHELSRLDGLLLMLALLFLMGWLVMLAKQNDWDDDPLTAEYKKETKDPMSMYPIMIWMVIGGAGLFWGASLIVSGAKSLAFALGWSDTLIGLTVVAVGTSLPELATTCIAAIKNEPEMAVGSIVGSNMFNMLGVLAMPALIHPGPIDQAFLTRDLPVLLGFTLLLFVMAYGFRQKTGQINRIEALMLLVGFVVYTWLLFR